MTGEAAHLDAVWARPAAPTPRLAYADWLADHGRPDRAAFLRLHLALAAAAPDHADRAAAEHELSRLRAGCDPAWLAVVEPDRAALADPAAALRCRCLAPRPGRRAWPAPFFHLDAQDTACDPWKRLLDRVEEAAADGRETFAPLRDMDAADRARIVTLPATLGRLTAVRTLDLRGSGLVRLPPEVGGMAALEVLATSASHRLHWFPFELTRCRRLRSCAARAGALYRFDRSRPTLPRLGAAAEVAPGRTEPSRLLPGPPAAPARPCGVCGRPFGDRREHRAWVSLPVATRVLPLLLNACSAACLAAPPGPSPERVVGADRDAIRAERPDGP